MWTDDGTTQEKYIYAHATIWAEVRTTDGKSATYYHHTDHTGTTECITDTLGKVVWEASYEAYGKLVHENGTVSFKASFTGKQIDEDTGLYYFNARWYDAELGRFVTEDPARDGTNWYEYCRNNPLGAVDPTGLAPYINGVYDGPYDPNHKTPDVTYGPQWDSSSGSSNTNSNSDTDTDSQQKAEPEEDHSPSGAELSSSRGTDMSQNDLSTSYFDTKSIDFHGVYYNGDFLGYGADAEERKTQLENLNVAEQVGDAASKASLYLNTANIVVVITGNIPTAEVIGGVAAGCDILALSMYCVSGNREKAMTAGIGIGLDLVPAMAGIIKPELSVGYNQVAGRFINNATKRFVTNTRGSLSYVSPSVSGVLFSVVSDYYGKEEK